MKLVADTGRALERIASQVMKFNELVGDVAASAQEQATGLNDVNTAMNQMDQVTQQNAAMVEQATAACHSLSGEAEELSGLVGQFRIGHETVRAMPQPYLRKAFTDNLLLREDGDFKEFAPRPTQQQAP